MKYRLHFRLKRLKLRRIYRTWTQALTSHFLARKKKTRKKKKTKRLNIKQFKRLWRDYNFRYLYKHANCGQRIKDDVRICWKIYGPLPEARWKMFGNFRKLQKMFHCYFTKDSRLTGNSLPGASSCWPVSLDHINQGMEYY